MKRVLALYYSQTGQLGRALDSLLSGLDREEFEVHVEAVRPVDDYPFPWGVGEFLDCFPESVVGEPPAMREPEFDPDGDWDLVVLAYTVWYLAPSLPIQGFLASPAARVLKDKPVVTLIACRNMWHTASERMKRTLGDLGAHQLDNVVVTDDGPAAGTFITTPRWMFTGRNDRFLGLPPAGVAAATIEGLARFGEALSQQRDRLDQRPSRPLLTGLGAVEVEERFVVPELVGRTIFPLWARFVRLGGGPRSAWRKPLLLVFAVNLVLTILIVLPISILLRLLLHPFIAAPLDAYVKQLRSPSGLEMAEGA